jgi:hypothetical protein
MQTMQGLLLDKLSEKIGNTSILIVLLFTLFIVPTMQNVEVRKLVFSSMFTLIFFMGVLAMEKYKKPIFVVAVLALITEWISLKLNMPVLEFISGFTNIVFFMIIVVRFITQIAKTKEVDLKVIIESINGYLLLGLAYSIVVAVVMTNIDNAYKFPEMINVYGSNSGYLHEYIYYTFVTFTTLGYGDIVPLLPISKSLTLLISISGQFYIAIIIAMLVGKYASTGDSKRNSSDS